MRRPYLYLLLSREDSEHCENQEPDNEKPTAATPSQQSCGMRAAKQSGFFSLTHNLHDRLIGCAPRGRAGVSELVARLIPGKLGDGADSLLIGIRVPIVGK